MATASNARRFLLKLLLAAGNEPLTVRELVAAGRVLGMTENSLRVALVRLTSTGMVEAQERGVYVLGSEAKALADNTYRWRLGEQRVRPWSGQWLLVHTGALARADRTALRQRERILHMMGFRKFERDLHARPDNLVDDVEVLRQHLHQLGLEKSACVMVADHFSAADEKRLRSLWDSAALSNAYRKTQRQLEAVLARIDELELEDAARETYRIGDHAIRQLVFDPLLPEPLIDVAARSAFTDTVLRFDAAGHRIWQKLADLRPAATYSPAARHVH